MNTKAHDKLGRYELISRLGDGGMADVYLARDGGRYVALKVLTGQRAAVADSQSLFEDEARVAGMLDHANVAAIYELDTVDDAQLLAMEYVHGVDLRQLLQRCIDHDELPSFEAAIAIVMQAAAGLDHAHRRCAPDGRPLRLVHRDVSLSNIMVRYDGVVKVVDFGIARTTMSSVHTQPGVVRGKSSYMAPEQAQGLPVDHRADVFALGIVLYELTTGARCFDGATDLDRMMSIVRGDYVLPTALAADYPRALEAVVRTALATDPRARYASCAAMIVALQAVLAELTWIGGATAVARMMHAVYGDVPGPTPLASRDSRNELGEHRARRRFARGSYVHLGEVCEDQPTTGRPLARRNLHAQTTALATARATG